jgi:chromosome segregation ATPase
VTASAATDDDPVRAAILAAMDRLLDGTPQRSEGRLSVSQLAAEADVKRWHLTHQHTDLKDTFQARVRQSQAGQAASARTASAYEELKARHAQLQRHCAALENRLQLYATTINALTLENAALSGQAAGSAKVVPLIRREPAP